MAGAKGGWAGSGEWSRGERSGQPAKSDCSGNVHVVGGAGEAEGGVEGAGLLGRARGKGNLAESLLCLVQSDLIQIQDISRHCTIIVPFVKMIIESGEMEL